MSTSTQQIARPTRSERDSLIFVQVFLDRIQTAETLRRLRNQRKNQFSAEANALLDAAIVIERDANRCVNEALQRGQLLFCAPGTTVLQGGAV